MKRVFYILILFSFSRQVLGQGNLVPNPSFEDTVGACVSTTNAIQKARYWKDFSASCDYYNGCASLSSQLSVPSNINGYQNAASGVAYVGFTVCRDTTATTWREHRETFGAKLTQTLTIGQKYYVSLKVVPTENGCWGCNKIGVKFTTFDANFPLIPNNPLVNNISHVYTNSVISDTINWTTIKGSFIADSAYRYIVIGNFFKDAATQTIPCSPTFGGYFLADDICVSTDSIFASTWANISEQTKKKSLLVYPNPTSEFILINTVDFTIIDKINIINNLGQVVFTKQINADKINISLIPDGIYFLEVLSEGKTYFDKIVIRH